MGGISDLESHTPGVSFTRSRERFGTVSGVLSGVREGDERVDGAGSYRERPCKADIGGETGIRLGSIGFLSRRISTNNDSLMAHQGLPHTMSLDWKAHNMLGRWTLCSVLQTKEMLLCILFSR